MSAIIIGAPEAAGRTRQGTFTPAQPCATRDSAQIKPTCVTGSLLFKTHCKPGAREVVTVRIRVGSGRAHRCIHRVPQAHELARIQFQSAHASRAVTAGVLSVISAPLRLFQFVPIVKAIGSLIPSLRVQPTKQSRGGFSKCLRSFSCAVFHDRNTTTGLRAWRAEKPSLSSRNWGMRS